MFRSLVSYFLNQNKQLRSRGICHESLFARCCNVSEIRKVSTDAVNKNEAKDSFVPIYNLPAIPVCANISRLKVYHAAGTIVSTPISILLHNNGIVDNIHIPIICVGIAGCTALCLVSYLFQNVIGAVYINKTSDSVKISSLDFWGKRIDTVCSRDDIVPLPESTKKKLIPTTTVSRHSSPEVLYLATEHGNVLDQLAFDKIFFKVQLPHELPDKSKTS